MTDNATFDFDNQRNRLRTTFTQTVEQQVFLLITLGYAANAALTT